jgi:hypothetical protein
MDPPQDLEIYWIRRVSASFEMLSYPYYGVFAGAIEVGWHFSPRLRKALQEMISGVFD